MEARHLTPGTPRQQGGLFSEKQGGVFSQFQDSVWTNRAQARQ
jgi:hypothetical protein